MRINVSLEIFKNFSKPVKQQKWMPFGILQGVVDYRFIFVQKALKCVKTC